VPRRRTLAAGILPFTRSEETALRPPGLRLVSYAGSRSTGSPSLSPVAQVVNLCAFLT